MAIVPAANIPIALAVDDLRAPAVSALLERWLEVGESLHAPALLPYEVANGLTRLVATNAFPVARLAEALEALMSLPLTYHHMVTAGNRVAEIALLLRRSNAYDAAYLELSERLGAMLWILDGPLYRDARDRDFQARLVE